jgi:thiol-disulfide isomerase/thioredoxin
MLREACINGGQNAFSAWAKAQDAILADSRVTGQLRYALRAQIIQRISIDPDMDDQSRRTQYEQALLKLAKDYPDQLSPYGVLLTLASQSSDGEARSIATRILAQTGQDEIREQAAAILHRLDALGKPLAVQFTAVDGREVDLSKMKGKVVLVDFWATWCMPCVEEMPVIKDAYDKFHTNGFEVVGISLDEDKGALTRFVQAYGIPWPQYFDGQRWQNKFAVEHSIKAVPAMWLVDKNGILQSENPRGDLQGAVEMLLKKN